MGIPTRAKHARAVTRVHTRDARGVTVVLMI